MQLVLRFLYFTAICVIAVLNPVSSAQDDAAAQRFSQEIWPITNTGFYPSKASDAAMWYAQGSLWTLDHKASKVPEALKTHLDRFQWTKWGWQFETPNCYPENKGFMEKVFSAGVDLEQVSAHQSTPFTLTQKQRSFSKSKKEGCVTLENRNKLQSAPGAFQLSGTLQNPDNLNRIVASVHFASGQTARLEYILLTPFERLTQTDWQMDFEDDALASCGTLRVSAFGDAGTSCCNGQFFKLEVSEKGWESSVGGGTQTGCGSPHIDVDNRFYAAMPQGLKLSDEGQLIIGTTAETQMSLRPVDRHEKFYGSWILSGLEMRSMHTPIQTLPRVQSVKSRQALIDKDIRLELTPKMLRLSSSCGYVEAPILSRKKQFLRLGKAVRETKPDCTLEAQRQDRLYRSFSQISGDYAVLYGVHNSDSGAITLTRVQLGSNYRSVSWIFSPLRLDDATP